MEDTYINVVGENKEEIAKAVADYYETKVVHFEDGAIGVLVNEDLEAAFCISENLMNEALDNLNSVYPNVNMTLDNFDF